mmetsp:Transcript_11522/g.28387  ORF Transcript_11522/g.28387 Transcript_11522/m.28387 type:complete len:480 (+) Transcript_11522:415-1854(+)|eukprot:CAMPEP_0114500444 /NCGR_PEP_ID=MMETSP0109-20121206/7965_1 /TAXON_ID=29199 /ORGANISM="Chlorarachnion reptans, Strain CCCM449" /LENGTH=479 /DNA_ID=CAMNT_0001678101 /DNA_START=336 /DNA_END=1771 /DNA_ORIENTATION=-
MPSGADRVYEPCPLSDVPCPDSTSRFHPGDPPEFQQPPPGDVDDQIQLLSRPSAGAGAGALTLSPRMHDPSTLRVAVSLQPADRGQSSRVPDRDPPDAVADAQVSAAGGDEDLDPDATAVEVDRSLALHNALRRLPRRFLAVNGGAPCFSAALSPKNAGQHPTDQSRDLAPHADSLLGRAPPALSTLFDTVGGEERGVAGRHELQRARPLASLRFCAEEADVLRRHEEGAQAVDGAASAAPEEGRLVRLRPQDPPKGLWGDLGDRPILVEDVEVGRERGRVRRRRLQAERGCVVAHAELHYRAVVGAARARARARAPHRPVRALRHEEHVPFRVAEREDARARDALEVREGDRDAPAAAVPLAEGGDRAHDGVGVVGHLVAVHVEDSPADLHPELAGRALRREPRHSRALEGHSELRVLRAESDRRLRRWARNAQPGHRRDVRDAFEPRRQHRALAVAAAAVLCLPREDVSHDKGALVP